MNASVKERRGKRAQLLRGVLHGLIHGIRSSHGDNAASQFRATGTAFVQVYHEADARSSRVSLRPLGSGWSQKLVIGV